MPIPAWDDPSEFINPDDFGVWAVIAFQAGGTRRIAVLFDDPAANIEFKRRLPAAPDARLGDFDADAEHPRITATVADLAGVTRKDSVTFEADGSTYGVLTNPKPDGNGCAIVYLVLES